MTCWSSDILSWLAIGWSTMRGILRISWKSCRMSHTRTTWYITVAMTTKLAIRNGIRREYQLLAVRWWGAITWWRLTLISSMVASGNEWEIRRTCQKQLYLMNRSRSLQNALQDQFQELGARNANRDTACWPVTMLPLAVNCYQSHFQRAAVK
jgi:hypothetical protein